MDTKSAGNKILIVEHSLEDLTLLTDKIQNELGLDFIHCKNIAETQSLVCEKGNDFFAAILDLTFQEELEEEVIDCLLEKKIPIIIITQNFDDEIRNKIIQKNIVDYILKNRRDLTEHIIELIQNLIRNKKTKVLIVDDSAISIKVISKLLNSQGYITFQAGSALEALRILQKNEDIKLVITDYNMPDMNGCDLVDNIRGIYPKDELAIIGISAYDNNFISANFLKKGANDYINKPFSEEEFKYRINQNIEILELIRNLREMATRDHLTGLYNRRAFNELGYKLFENTKRGNIQISIAMIDIDNFKKINDTFGHNNGDLVIQKVAQILKLNFRSSDIISRMGGEEFCIIAVNLKEENALNKFKNIKNQINSQVIPVDNTDIKFTVSIGIINKIFKTFEETIHQADLLLYKAKENGRNCIICDNKQAE